MDDHTKSAPGDRPDHHKPEHPEHPEHPDTPHGPPDDRPKPKPVKPPRSYGSEF